jgi:hypothetical protein
MMPGANCNNRKGVLATGHQGGVWWLWVASILNKAIILLASLLTAASAS